MKSRILLFLSFTVLTIIGISAKDYELKAGEFNRLKVTDSINVVYHTATADHPSGLVRFSSPENIADALMFTNKNGELKIMVHTDYVNSPNLPTLHLSSDFLTQVVNEGEGTITVENLMPCAEVKFRVIGNGKIVASGVKSTTCSASIDTGCGSVVVNGECRVAKFKLVGTGLIQADQLSAQTVECAIMGAGSIGCNPQEKLEVKGIGSTKIYYRGDPEIKKRGGGNIIKID